MVPISGLPYVGALPAGDTDVMNRLAVSTRIAAAPVTQGSVQAQITALVAGGSPTYATKSYVDTQDGTFVLPSYYQGRDALNIPLTALGQPSGVASLSADATPTVPLAQIPVAGAGYIKGPYGPTASATGTTGATPLKIADWNIGAAGVSFRPWVFLSAFVTGASAQPVIEVRIADATSAPTYAASTLVAEGAGRSLYDDYHAIAFGPAPDATGATPSLLAPTYRVWLTAWLYDLNGNSVTLSAGGLASGAAFLLRGSL